jgi:dTDP-4-amino-4,6-dideoxygalactose transaminase
LGGCYKGAPIGNGRYSDITVFSFHPIKIITTAEGGMAVTNDPLLAERMLRLRSHGVTRDPAFLQNDRGEPWYYEQIELGYNYRMSDVQAALGASQFRRIDVAIARRRELAIRYDEHLRELTGVARRRSDPRSSACHLYLVRVAPEFDRSTIFRRMRSAGVGVHVHYIPVHLQPYYRQSGFQQGDFPESEQYYRETLTLPLYPTLNDSDQDRVVAALKSALG